MRSADESASRPAARGRRTALVTGAGSGIGRAIALELARGGLRVAAVGRRREALEETAREDRTGRIAVFVGDVLQEAWTQAVAAWAPAGVDVLVHDAMAYAPYARLEHGNAAAEQSVLAVGVEAALALCRRFVPAMRAHGFGRVVFVGSRAASLGAPGQAAYATAKSALAGLTRSLAGEVGRDGVTVNLVEPGLVDTERVRSALSPERSRTLASLTGPERAATAAEIAHVVAFLAGDAASFTTGAVWPICGGLDLGLASRRGND